MQPYCLSFPHTCNVTTDLLPPPPETNLSSFILDALVWALKDSCVFPFLFPWTVSPAPTLILDSLVRTVSSGLLFTCCFLSFPFELLPRHRHSFWTFGEQRAAFIESGVYSFFYYCFPFPPLSCFPFLDLHPRLFQEQWVRSFLLSLLSPIFLPLNYPTSISLYSWLSFRGAVSRGPFSYSCFLLSLSYIPYIDLFSTLIGALSNGLCYQYCSLCPWTVSPAIKKRGKRARWYIYTQWGQRHRINKNNNLEYRERFIDSEMKIGYGSEGERMGWWWRLGGERAGVLMRPRMYCTLDIKKNKQINK